MMKNNKSADKVLDPFTVWMRNAGITWDDALISFFRAPTSPTGDGASYSGLALAVYASAHIDEGQELCRIPKSSCITVKTSSISDILEQENLKGGLGLVIAVLYEASLGKTSKWSGYFESMPPREYVPVFWTTKEISLLRGTELESSTQQEQTYIREDFESEVLPLITKHPSKFKKTSVTAYFSDFNNFMDSASLVASRAFGVDDEHGDGMVPLADVFNHKVSVVDLAPGYHVHSSSLDLYDSDDDDEQLDDDNDELDDAGEMQRVVQKSDTHSVYGILRANGLPLQLEIAIIDQDEHLQIIAASDVKKECEIHNTYGELGNAELVKKYAFALMDNPFTVVTLSKQSVVDACAALYTTDHAGEERPKKRPKKVFDGLIQLLKNETELLNEDEEPFEVQCNGFIGPALFWVLHVLCSGCGGKTPFTSIDESIFCDGKEIDASSSVQVWKVLDEDGKRLSKKERKKWRTLKGASEEEQMKMEMMDVAMCKALLNALNIRLTRYKEESAEKVIKKHQKSGNGRGQKLSKDHATAKKAALLLKVSEMKVLEDMKTAINEKLSYCMSSCTS